MYCFLVVLCFYEVAGKELLGNHDFENGNSISPWTCADCRATITTSNKYHGQHGVVVNNRHHNWAGLAQSFSAPGGHDYYCSAYIKILNVASGKSYASVDFMLQYNNGKDHYVPAGQNGYLMADGTFSEIGGDFHLPNGVNQARLYIQITDPSVNYVLDYATCQQIVHHPNWRTNANQRIENLRKGTLTINLAGTHDTTGLTVQVVQKKSQFALGTAFNARYVTDSNHAAYQKFLFDNFEWAVPENAMKWKQMEWTRGHINYNTAMDAVKKLKSKGFKVRGHNMFWDDPRRIPDWVTGLSRNDALKAMHKRVNDMMSHSMGTLEHWDVNNENLHSHPFEDLVHDPEVSEDMFKWMHAVEPNVKLFLNEYNVITYHQTTTALKTLGQHYKAKGVPIYGLGAQGHFGNSHINMDVLKYRLDKLAESGLPIWITELTIKETDAAKKALALDNLMTMFFSHPHVEGVLLWGFWDGAIYDKDLSLATGSSVTPNAAGQKWIELFHRRFRTNESHQFNGKTSVSAKAFYGDYQLVFQQHGRIIHTENLSFTHGSKTVRVHL